MKVILTLVALFCTRYLGAHTMATVFPLMSLCLRKVTYIHATQQGGIHKINLQASEQQRARAVIAKGCDVEG